VIWPAFAAFWSGWAPPNERSRLIGIANAGSQIGNVIALPLGGYLCINGLDGGWPSIFYLFGSVGAIWFIIWMIVSTNSPADNKFIRSREQEYVMEETKAIRDMHERAEKGAPWKAIMTSKYAISIFVGHSCSNWGTYLFLTSLPTYMKQVLKFDIKSVRRLRLPQINFQALPFSKLFC
jgi:MFS family permease